MQSKAVMENFSGCQKLYDSLDVSNHVEHWESCTLLVGV